MILRSRIERWLLVTILGLILLVGCGQSPRFGIVFTSNRNGNFEIYRMTSDGQNVEQLTHTSDSDEQGAEASPDGSKILFSRGGSRLEREIYFLDVASGAVTQLTDAPAYDLGGTWSPDGSRIAFISDRDGGYYRLYLMNPDGSDQQHIPLATDPERDVASVSWSPDGRKLVYGTSGHLYHHADVTPTLYIVDLATAEVTRLTDEKRHGACMQPDWSPDGEWITMVCTKGTTAGDYGEIYVIHPDGSGLSQVTTRRADYEPNIPAHTVLTWVMEPRWSPDSKEIVYVAAVDSPWNIYIIGADGSDNRRLTNHDAVDWRLSVYRLP